MLLDTTMFPTEEACILFSKSFPAVVPERGEIEAGHVLTETTS